MGHLSQAATAESEVSVETARASADSATVVQFDDWIFAFAGSNPSLVLFVDHRCFGHGGFFSFLTVPLRTQLV